MVTKEKQLTIKDLLECGAHFGHQKYRWNPKMKRYIFEERNGIYIIDLSKTIQQVKKAIDLVKNTVTQNKSILFVGTKKQAKDVIKNCAEESGEYYVCERWLGGMLTNLTTIRKSIKTLEQIEKKIATASEGLTKKELSELSKKQIKLDRQLSGIPRARWRSRGCGRCTARQSRFLLGFLEGSDYYRSCWGESVSASGLWCIVRQWWLE